jgi:hypothetical protein
MGYIVRPRPATHEGTRWRLYSLSLAGRIGQLVWAKSMGQVTDQEYLERRRLIDLLDGFGWWEPDGR